MKNQDEGGANDTPYFLEKLKFTSTEKEKHLKQRFSEIQRHTSAIAAFRLSMMSGEFHRSAVVRWTHLAERSKMTLRSLTPGSRSISRYSVHVRMFVFNDIHSVCCQHKVLVRDERNKNNVFNNSRVK